MSLRRAYVWETLPFTYNHTKNETRGKRKTAYKLQKLTGQHKVVLARSEDGTLLVHYQSAMLM